MRDESELIGSLVDDLKPFKKTWSFWVYWFVTLIILYVAGAILTNDNFDFVASDSRHAYESLALTLVGTWALFHAFRYADPLTHKVGTLARLSAVGIGLFCLSIYFTAQPDFVSYFASSSWARAEIESMCTLLLLGASTVIGIWLGASLTRLAPMKSTFVSFFAVVGASSFATMFLRLVCHASSPEHFLLWHYLPAVGATLVGYIALKAFLRSRF
ncbi:MAG: DUF1109 family protein [Pseudobacteriovorax sp.]|nr:DUF1109 family protein [Pseudobacteriovorax sp.]